MEQRSIKFRAWIKDYGMMVRVKNLHLSGGIEFLVPVRGNGSEAGKYWLERDSCDEESEYETMQFTGLADKNGTEIYEGDIVEYQGRRNARFKVDMAETDFIVPLSDEASDIEMPPDRFHQRSSYFEVIGNIYDNADLLQNQTLKGAM